MKKILITGANSYIGTSFESWLAKYPEDYIVDTIDVKGEAWKEYDFSSYDVVFHVAGIAHVSRDPKLKELYYKVNRDLTIEVATKARNEGVEQFIFMSSIIVYGESSADLNVITKDTMPNPSNFYGDSKLQAEKEIQKLQCENFKVAIIRPPMIYGKGSKGNYPKLAKFARTSPIFPQYNNQRSMLHIDNLCEFIRLMIDNCETGLFYPQNEDFVNTSEIVRLIAQVNGNQIYMTSYFNVFINVMLKNVSIVRKLFGNLIYDPSLSYYKENYRVTSFEDSIKSTESETM